MLQGEYTSVLMKLYESQLAVRSELSHVHSQTSKSSLRHQILSRVPCLHLFLCRVACSIYFHFHHSSWWGAPSDLAAPRIDSRPHLSYNLRSLTSICHSRTRWVSACSHTLLCHFLWQSEGMGNQCLAQGHRQSWCLLTWRGGMH